MNLGTKPINCVSNSNAYYDISDVLQRNRKSHIELVVFHETIEI